MNLMTASHQWATRPDDERFTSLKDLHESVLGVRERSAARVVASRDLTCEPIGTDHKGLAIRGPSGALATIGHGAFGQLATLAGAPAGYLRRLPSEMAADCINYGLKVSRDVSLPADYSPADRPSASERIDRAAQRIADRVTMRKGERYVDAPITF